MSINNICLNVSFYKLVNFGQNHTFDLNVTISFFDSFRPPEIFNKLNGTHICGQLVKILENLAKRTGSK